MKRQVKSQTQPSGESSAYLVRRKRQEPGEVPPEEELNPDDFSASEAYDDKMKELRFFMELKEEHRINIGITFHDFIKECTYLGKNCKNSLLFQMSSSPQYGNCFTFNTNLTDSQDPLAGKRRTGLTGEQYSLNMILDLKHHAFPPTLVDTKGARVQIHPSDEVPDVGASGLNIYPNAATSFGIEQLTIQRLPAPYKAKCINSWSQADFQPTMGSEETAREAYTVARCKKMCLQDKFVEHCRCSHSLYPLPGTYKKNGEEPNENRIKPCLLTVAGEDSICTLEVQSLVDNATLTCNCPTACFERRFNVLQSMAEWPRPSYLGTVASRMNIRLGDLPPPDLMALPTNIMEIKVFFKTLNTATLVQSPQYSDFSLLSSLGGSLSLYLGISLVMLAELVEFLLMVVYNLCRYSRGKYGADVAPAPRAGAPAPPGGDVSEIIIRRSNNGAPRVAFGGVFNSFPTLKKPG